MRGRGESEKGKEREGGVEKLPKRKKNKKLCFKTIPKRMRRTRRKNCELDGDVTGELNGKKEWNMRRENL